MPPSTARNLISLFRSATRLTSERCITTAAKKKPNHNSILHVADEMDLASDTPNIIGGVINMWWQERMSNKSMSDFRKEFTRDKKHKLVFNKTRTRRFGRTVNACAEILGPDATVEVFGKLGLETEMKEYNNSLIGICINKARDTTRKDVSLPRLA